MSSGTNLGNTGTINGHASQDISAFDETLEDFKTRLKKGDRDNFRMTTIDDLQSVIAELQKQQITDRRMKNFTRLKRFIEAIDQYGKVIEVFCNSSEFVAFIWGPMKFLLQVASSFSEAFSELLAAYQRIGENLPLLMQYQQLFERDPRMVKVLSLMYKDIFEFHRRALHYFQQPMWKKLYHATWKTFKTRFSSLIDDMYQHRVLIESQANISQIEEARRDREVNELKFKFMFEKEDIHRRQIVVNWLRAPNAENDQDYYAALRAECPASGAWLFEKQQFKDWFSLNFPAIPALLWLNGIPGAGKTILASLVVEKARQLTPAPTVLFFYCKHGDPQRDNLVSMCKALLSQLLKQNADLLPYYFQESSNSSEAILTSSSVSKELLELGLKNSRRTYIILDGLDECPREERKTITTWFRNLIEGLPPANPDAIRCLFVSQDDGIARKDFGGLSTISICESDNKADIKEYSTIWTSKIKEKFELADDKSQEIVMNVSAIVGGMFLLAKLIWSNLFHQTSLDSLLEELDPTKIPKEINDAYGRIMYRIFQQSSPNEQKDCLRLLSWIVCAKRPLKWHEIQGAKSINVEFQNVEWERRRFRVDAKDLCGSLIETRADDTVELVHLTAKYFLVDAEHVFPSIEELRMANLCIDYLNLPGFTGGLEIRDEILNGYYAFMEYAILYWLRHLEAGLFDASGEKLQSLIRDLEESLEAFLARHWTTPTIIHKVSQRNSDRLQIFKEMAYYETLEQAVVSTRKQLTFFGNMKKEEIALDVSEILYEIRAAMESLISAAMDDITQKKMVKMYGVNLFKCPRLSCQYFSNGFATREDRDQHVEKHERPFRCTVEGCPTAVLGLVTAKDLERHMKETHRLSRSEDYQFPTEADLIPDKETDRAVTPPPKAPDTSRVAKTKEKKIHKCAICSKIFSRFYNLQSHMVTHSTERPYRCKHCGTSFARFNDCMRHEKCHDGESFICSGVTKDGRHWGCGKEFSRADTLKKHHRSQTGQECTRLLLEEQDQGQPSSVGQEATEHEEANVP